MLYNIVLYSWGSDIIITNAVKRIDKEIIEVPLIIKADREGWVPTFDIWPTIISRESSYIDCTQTFGSKLKHYEVTELNSQIGYFNDDNLVICWKTLVDSANFDVINNAYNGRLRATCWQKRYCTYFSTSSDMPWLHSVILGCGESDHVIHHIDGVSVDNRHQNLHILPKREHDSINHPLLDERRQMFFNPEEYWRRRRNLAVEEFITQLALIITYEGQANFIAKFAEENMTLAKEILETAKLYINLSSVKSRTSKNRTLNPHLKTDYLDAYETEKYLKRSTPKSKLIAGQLKLF